MKLTFGLMVWLLAGLLCPTARSGLPEGLSLGQLTSQAQLIVHGTVLSRSCQKDSEGRVYTKIELNLKEVWKGKPSSNPLLLVHGGGVLGEERVVVTGQVDYQVGEEVVAFLVLNPRGEAVTIGLAQGRFGVWRENPQGEAFVHNPFHGLSPARAKGQGLRSASLPTDRLSLKKLKEMVTGAQP